MLLKDALKNYSDYELATQYCPSNEKLETTLCFFNFYGQVFPDANLDLDLHIFFFDKKGMQTGYVVEKIPGRGFIQIDVRKYVTQDSGMVCLMAIPGRSVTALAQQKNIRIRKKLGTGYYVVWKNASGSMDTMHEWMPVNAVRGHDPDHYLVIDFHERIKSHGIILMNSCFPGKAEEDVRSHPVVEVYSNRLLLESFQIDSIGPMNTVEVNLEESVAKLEGWLKKYKSLLVKVRGDFLSPPLTKETHVSGDFHIHHIE